MYLLLGKEIAEVDPLHFEKVGQMSHKVVATVVQDQLFSVKGSPSCSQDDEVDCQNTMFLQLEAETHFFNNGTIDFFNSDALNPGDVYKYVGSDSSLRDELFVELKYDFPLGRLTLIAYFLVDIKECAFALNNGNGFIAYDSFEELAKDGYVRKVKNG